MATALLPVTDIPDARIRELAVHPELSRFSDIANATHDYPNTSALKNLNRAFAHVSGQHDFDVHIRQNINSIEFARAACRRCYFFFLREFIFLDKSWELKLSQPFSFAVSPGKFGWRFRERLNPRKRHFKLNRQKPANNRYRDTAQQHNITRRG